MPYPREKGPGPWAVHLRLGSGPIFEVPLSQLDLERPDKYVRSLHHLNSSIDIRDIRTRMSLISMIVGATEKPRDL